MHKHPITIPDHPAEIKKSGRGSSEGSSSNKTTVKRTESRDDEQARSGSDPASLPPENVSSAAAAAAAAAASFAAANANNSKTSRSKRGYDAAGNQASAEPPQKQGRSAGRKLGDGGSTGAWPVSPIVDDKKDETPAVTSSSSAGLSPIKLEGKDGEQQDGEEPLMDFSASPIGPPEIQNSNRDDHSFSPKNFFGDEKAVSKAPAPLINGPGGLDMSASFNLFSHSFDSLGGVMPNLDVGALNSFGGIGGTGSDGVVVAPIPSMSLSFLQQDSINSPKPEPVPMIKDNGKGNDGTGTSGKKKKKKKTTTKKDKDDLSRAEILNGSPIKLTGLSPSSSFVMPVGGENAAMADLVLNGGSVASGGLIDDKYGGRPKYRGAATGHGQAYSHHPSQQYHGYGGAYDHTHGQSMQGYSQPIPPTVGVSPLEGAPAFYFVLRRWRKCFGRFTFLLPGLKVRETCSVNVSAIGGITLTNGSSKKTKVAGGSLPYTDHRGKQFPDPNPAEIEIATRRVIAAVCAFGGSVQRASTPSRQTGSSSIFRTKYTGSSLPKTKQQIAYEERLPQRYYENNNHLSWEVEDSPPIVVSSEEEELVSSKSGGSGKKGSKNSTTAPGGRGSGSIGKAKSPSPSPPPGSSAGDPPKMKYRCKLCGQPKQNHVCPYQQALQRSIGTMCYPAVNAYSSVEPGIIAPALNDANNFTEGIDDVSPLENTSPRTIMGPDDPHNVTPESMRSSLNKAKSPDSMLPGTPESISRRQGHGAVYFSPHQRQMRRGEYSKMRGFGTELPSHPLFKEPMNMKREQFRTVSSPKDNSKRGAFTYPSLPLTYTQRKRLSDSLFAMSKEVPGLTDECAIVLREGRQKQKWDLAVAELLTQVVITVHCRDGDNTLEGLRQYLLTLGIAC